MYRQPIAGFLLLSVAGAVATHRDQGLAWDPTGHLTQQTAPRKLDPEAVARARAEWEDMLRSAEVRLMAFERIAEQPVAPPEVVQDSTGQQVLRLGAPRRHAADLHSEVPKLAPAARQPEEERSARTDRKSSAGAIASNRVKSTEPWIYDFSSTR